MVLTCSSDRTFWVFLWLLPGLDGLSFGLLATPLDSGKPNVNLSSRLCDSSSGLWVFTHSLTLGSNSLDGPSNSSTIVPVPSSSSCDPSCCPLHKYHLELSPTFCIYSYLEVPEGEGGLSLLFIIWRLLRKPSVTTQHSVELMLLGDGKRNGNMTTPVRLWSSLHPLLSGSLNHLVSIGQLWHCWGHSEEPSRCLLAGLLILVSWPAWDFSIQDKSADTCTPIYM